MKRGKLLVVVGALVVALLGACTTEPSEKISAPESSVTEQDAAGDDGADASPAAKALGPVTQGLLAIADCDSAFPQYGSLRLRYVAPDFVGANGYRCAGGNKYGMTVFEEPGADGAAKLMIKDMKKDCWPVGYAIAFGDGWAAETADWATYANAAVLKALAAKFDGTFFSCGVKRLSGREEPPTGLQTAARTLNGACQLEGEDYDPKARAITWECSNEDLLDDLAALYIDFMSFDPRDRDRVLQRVIDDSGKKYGYEVVYGSDWLVVTDGETARSTQWASAKGSLDSLGIATESRPPTKRTPKESSGPSWETWEGTFLYRWLKPAEFECNADWCWAIEVDPVFECPDGVYAEANFLNGSGRVVDWSNDSIPVLSDGQTGELVFGTFEPKPSTVELVTLDCYE